MFETKAGGPPTGRLSLEVLPQFKLFEIGKLQLNAFGGLNVSANTVKDQAEEFFRDLPELSEVYNSVGNAVIPITANITHGGSIEYANRIVFWAKYQPTSFYAREIEVGGQSYPFENRWNFFSMTLGYKLYNLGFKKKVDI
jgi:hypothetical protein